MDRQSKIAESQKNNGKHLFGVLMLIDDFGDKPVFTLQFKLLHQLYVRGRHSFISTITSAQKATTLHPLIHTHAGHAGHAHVHLPPQEHAGLGHVAE